MTFCAVCQHWKSWTCLIKVSLSWSCVRFIPPYCSISSKDAPILGVSFWTFKPPHVCLDYYVLISNLYVMFIFPITKLCVFCFRELHMNMQWSWSYGLILESNKEIYQKILEPLLKELKVGDDIFQDLHNTNSNSNSKESNSQTWLWVSLSFSICVTLFYTSCINSRLTMLFHCCRVSSHMRSWTLLFFQTLQKVISKPSQ